MTKIAKSKKNSIDLHLVVANELKLIHLSDTIGGALTHLASLLNRVRTIPAVAKILAEAEKELEEDDRNAFESLEKSVAWFEEKIRLLLLHVEWSTDSFFRKEANDLLNFRVFTLSEGGHLSNLLFTFRHLCLDVPEKDRRRLFEGFAEFKGELYTFNWPNYVNQNLHSLPRVQQIHQWKEKADTNLPCLIRFLKILSLYPTFNPVVITPNSSPEALPKNFKELEKKQWEACVGSYLSGFRSAKITDHPLSIPELIKLVDRFLVFLQQKIAKDLQKPADLRTEKCQQDVQKFIPLAKQLWVAKIESGANPLRLGVKALEAELAKKPPTGLHTQKDNERVSRARAALKITDPRRYEGGKLLGLQTNWQSFWWVTD